MKAESLTIIRFKHQDKQTLGKAVLLDKYLMPLMEFKTVELPWKDNQRGISCIPTGIYDIAKHTSPKFGPALWVLAVPGRSEILIHQANFWHDLRGCIAPGKKHTDIDGDGYRDVTSSKDTMAELLALCPDRFKLIIKDL